MSGDSGMDPLSVNFIDLSTGSPINWNWSFNNVTGNNTNIIFATTQNPHLIFGIGNFSIQLNVSNSSSYSISPPNTAFINVSPYISYPIVNFIANITRGTSPLPVQFNDSSFSGITSWNLSFGDGTWNNQTIASLSNVTKIYNTPGIYSVSEYVTNSSGTNLTIKLNYITVINTPTVCIYF